MANGCEKVHLSAIRLLSFCDPILLLSIPCFRLLRKLVLLLAFSILLKCHHNEGSKIPAVSALTGRMPTVVFDHSASLGLDHNNFLGPSDVPRVSQYRLAAHLSSAVILYSFLFWNAKVGQLSFQRLRWEFIKENRKILNLAFLLVDVMVDSVLLTFFLGRRQFKKKIT